VTALPEPLLPLPVAQPSQNISPSSTSQTQREPSASWTEDGCVPPGPETDVLVSEIERGRRPDRGADRPPVCAGAGLDHRASPPPNCGIEERVSSAYGPAPCRRSPLDADTGRPPAYRSSGVTAWDLRPRPDAAWRPSRRTGCSSFRRVGDPQCIPTLLQRVLAKDRAIPTPARCGGPRGSRRPTGCSRLLALLVETTT
jgi:hypothetical protein